MEEKEEQNYFFFNCDTKTKNEDEWGILKR
jgi:hypothetical protein